MMTATCKPTLGQPIFQTVIRDGRKYTVEIQISTPETAEAVVDMIARLPFGQFQSSAKVGNLIIGISRQS